jgi:GAF domain-containing protein
MSQCNSIASRYGALLRVNKLALTRYTAESVFEGLCAVLAEMVPFERAVLCLYDPTRDGLKIVDVQGSARKSVFGVGELLGRGSSQTGWTFEHKRTMFRRDIEKEIRFPTDKAATDEGYRSVCSVPLVVRDDSVGVVTVASGRQCPLTVRHVEIVQELSGQIALVVSSSMLRCTTHPGTRLVCPRCIGAAGGKTTVTKHREDLSAWGKKGGRGRRIVNLVE